MYDPSKGNFSHMTEFDSEDPANAAQDLQDYQDARMPLESLLARLGFTTIQLRNAVRLNWANKRLSDEDLKVCASNTITRT